MSSIANYKARRSGKLARHLQRDMPKIFLCFKHRNIFLIYMYDSMWLISMQHGTALVY